jgi:hypothetical protein
MERLELKGSSVSRSLFLFFLSSSFQANKTNKNYKTYKANSNILKLLPTHLNILARVYLHIILAVT